MLESHFWSKVERRNADECWPWLGSVDRGGYGQVRKGKTMVRAHRASWELLRGAIPVGLCVLHRCDNRRCVNPGHLFVGTHVDNMIDKHSKGRQSRGMKHVASRPNYVLNEAEVQIIRLLATSTRLTLRAIGDLFMTSPSNVRLIEFSGSVFNLS